ncbi:MAG: FxsA family protein [Elusimicrobia bacterium]|nr:FxsA family protein [Elusimicrobiota bacterium]
MLIYLIIIFIALPVIELIILINISQSIGVFYTIFLILFTGIAGALLARAHGYIVVMKIMDDIGKGRMPADKLIDGAMILVGGIMLLAPGLVTDTLGFILIIPISRRFLKTLIKRKLQKTFIKDDIYIDAEIV